MSSYAKGPEAVKNREGGWVNRTGGRWRKEENVTMDARSFYTQAEDRIDKDQNGNPKSNWAKSAVWIS